MAKNKRAVDRHLKTDEIENAATRLFVERGFDATSMAMIAAEADVAPNTLYWYYPSKDDILVGVLNRLVAAGLSEWNTQRDQPFAQQLLWVIEQFTRSRDLVSTVHARTAHSDSVREWHDQFHAMLDTVLVRQLSSRGMSASQAKLMATIGTFVVEGLLSHPHSASQREAVVNWLAGKPGSPARDEGA